MRIAGIIIFQIIGFGVYWCRCCCVVYSCSVHVTFLHGGCGHIVGAAEFGIHINIYGVAHDIANESITIVVFLLLLLLGCLHLRWFVLLCIVCDAPWSDVLVCAVLCVTLRACCMCCLN